MTPAATAKAKGSSPQTEAFFADLLQAQPVMYGPDPKIVGNHRLAPRTEHEERALKRVTEEVDLVIASNRLEVICESAKEMLEQIGAAPGAKWGDLTCGIYTAKGDLAISTSTGVVVFAVVASPIVKHIVENWTDEPTVGVRPGDIFYHNDCHYGGVHNADQTLFLPVFDETDPGNPRLLCWAGATIHEGENGANEPGGLSPSAKSPYEEGLRIAPMKVGENYKFRRDVVNMFQNHVRDPLLQLMDMRSKLACAKRIEERVLELVKEQSDDLVVATLRSQLERTEAEVRRRLAEFPDGVYRATTFGDTTLLEDRMIKVSVEITKQGERLMVNTSGSAPAILDRAMNSGLPLTKALIHNDLMNFFWADLPRNNGFVSAVDFVVEEGSIFNASKEHPMGLSMLSTMFLHTATHLCMTKMAFNRPGTVAITAPWYAMVQGLFYGGLNQWNMPVANLMTDINAMGGAAHPDRDGEHAAAPFFAALADYGEMEDRETELPVLGLWRKINKDNHGYGRRRGGASVECAYMVHGVPMFALGCMATGAKFPTIPGMFGGYGPPSTPVTVFRAESPQAVRKVMAERPDLVPDSAELLHATKPFPGTYETRRPTQSADFFGEGDLWVLQCGGGGGYGDVLERDPEAVIKDLREQLLTDWVARNVYHVVYDDELVVDPQATAAARAAERKARLERGKPYDEFVAAWRREEPPASLPFLGTWQWETAASTAAVPAATIA
jgi:N-methylhydantoinase B/oxoprolinase/acetone carboxylase alpha subunit